jgi:hypothetical protein
MFGFDAEMSFTAPDSDTYLVIVADVLTFGDGGYVLEVREPYEGAPTPMAPAPTAEPVGTEFGEMAVYQSYLVDMSFLYPGDWSAAGAARSDFAQICAGVTACFGKDNMILGVVEEDLSGLPVSTLDDYADGVTLKK